METYQVGVIALALFALFAGFAFYSWRRRITKQASFLDAPEFVDGNEDGFKTFYVATTFNNSPLERIVAHGFAHRGIAYLSLSKDYLVVSRVGEKSFTVPISAISSVSNSSSVIDRAVERNGLLTLSWRLGEEVVDSHFRFVNTEHRESMVRELQALVGV